MYVCVYSYRSRTWSLVITIGFCLYQVELSIIQPYSPGKNDLDLVGRNLRRRRREEKLKVKNGEEAVR